uniref:TEP1-F n=1 Tax=Ammothea sp. RS-2014 TaxID=1569307 RepID=A0A0E3VMY0_9CHEL|nr:alpha-2-macroglobulin 2 [Ammothea sp. RS-2014]
MKLILLAVACLAFYSKANAERGYLFTAPKVLDAGTSERLCLTLTDVKGPGTVTVSLLKEKIDEVIAETSVNFPRDDMCFFIEIRNTKLTRGNLKIQGKFDSDDYSFESESPVSIASRSTLTYVQTDKAVYKPGQKVQFRILTVNHLLEPLPTEISKVYVLNPNGIRVAQWLGIKNENGLIQLDLQLSDESARGQWKINAQVKGSTISQDFEVDEYVLPKFEVTITPPTFLSSNMDIATWKICARYTYGKGVQGTLKAKLEYVTYSYERDRDSFPETNLEVKINGCHDLTVYAKTMKWNTRKMHYKSLKLNAEVEEEGTDIKFSSSSSMSISHEPLFLNFKNWDRQKYFHPGLPYHGQLHVTLPNGQNAPDELIQVCYEAIVSSCRNFTSDSHGIINFTVPPQGAEATYVKIKALAPNHPSEFYPNDRYAQIKIRQPSAENSLTPWYSPSGSFLKLKPVLGTSSCNEEVPLDVFYTTSGEDIQLHYQVMSRGRIVTHGMKSYKFNENDYQDDSYTIQNENVNERQKRFYSEKVNYTLPKHIGKFSLPIKISAHMSPVARVLIYYIRTDGEVVAASTSLDVMPCFANKASFTFEKDSVKPGEAAKYKISAAPKSLCAVGVVDKSVHLLKSDNQITSEKIFKVLKSFDTGRYTYPTLIDDSKYCKERLEGKIPTESPFDSTTQRPEPINPFGFQGLRLDELVSSTSSEAPTTEAEEPGSETTSVAPTTEEPTSTEFVDKQPEGAPPSVFRKKRSSPPRFYSDSYSSSYVDALLAFESSGVLAMSDRSLESRLCSFFQRRHLVYASPGFGGNGVQKFGIHDDEKGAGVPSAASGFGSGGGGGVNEAVEVRTYFPETWLWDLEVVGDAGYTDKEAEIPHTITEWVGSMFCTSKTNGLGISSPTAIKAFQPFFVSYALPYSVVRKEKVPIIVSVFNYLSECLPIQLKLEKSDEFTLLSDSYTHRMCVCGGQPATHRFRILPTGLGEVNLTVYSHSFNDANNEVCSKDKKASTLEARDAITKPLLVEPEGFPQESTESTLFCPSEYQNGFKKSFELMLPDDLVEGSARAFLSVSGDIMGPSLSGLEKLVARPTGCGEQNMIRFAPNIFVMQYLQGTSSLTPEIEKKALDFMRIGYQRELNYRHDDGSYSAFGKSDAEGSSWLTAFVVKSFAQARQFIDIDPVDLKKSTDWLLSKQQADGCFPFIGMVHHQDMKGGVGKSVPTALTAYTVISLLEAETPISQDKLDKAFECISKQTDPNSYTMALTAYAYALAGRYELANKIIDSLFSRATIQGTDVYWSTSSKSISVELGSYVILSLMKMGGAANQAKALSIVRWIARQRNANGGFVSTQDTVIALQAFAKFAVIHSKNKQDLEVIAEGNNFNQKYAINSTNRLLMQKDKVVELPNIIDVSAVGDGCGLIQTTLKYNKDNVNASDALELIIVGKADRWNCKRPQLDICARYKILGEKSNMAVISVKMISGYIPVKSLLADLKDVPELNLKRYEVDANYVNFYFDYLSNKQTCFALHVEKEIDVEDAKPAIASVYDYYVTELKLEKSYSLPVVDCKKTPHVEPLDDVPGLVELTTAAAVESTTVDDEQSTTVDDEQSTTVDAEQSTTAGAQE